MRRRLPHIRDPGHVQHVVFCTRGAFTTALPETPDRTEIADRLLDESPHGRVLVGAAADAVADVLQRRAPEDYRLLAWCVMLNHVHALVQPVVALDAVVGAWKSVSARAVNRLAGRSGPLWQANYFDRYMRDEDQLDATVSYIENNPVAAGLVAKPGHWRWSSAAP